jgi:hypothetical protein
MPFALWAAPRNARGRRAHPGAYRRAVLLPGCAVARRMACAIISIREWGCGGESQGGRWGSEFFAFLHGPACIIDLIRVLFS